MHFYSLVIDLVDIDEDEILDGWIYEIESDTKRELIDEALGLLEQDVREHMGVDPCISRADVSMSMQREMSIMYLSRCMNYRLIEG